MHALLARIDITPHACRATGSLQLALSNGGAPTAVWGWILVACMTLTVGLSMAEIVSSLPTSGGPYFWCDWLQKHAC